MRRNVRLLALLACIAVIFGTMYGLVQQTIRIGANDPQIQLAEDTATKLDAGATPQDLFKDSVDIGKSLAPFVVVYDTQDGHPVAGNGYLHNALPAFPFGVLQHSLNKAHYDITWQPEGALRIASVSLKAKNYFVVSGRSLLEVERRENKALSIATAGWLMTSAVAAAAFYYLERQKQTPTKK